MKTEYAFILLEFIEENWERFELKCNEINPDCDPEDVYQHLQKEALK